MQRIARALILGLAACGGAARPPAAKPATPCIAGPSLAASDLYQKLEKHSWWMPGQSDPAPPAEKLGTCTAHEGQLVDASGKLIAGLGCGVEIHVPGIHDDIGIEVGAHGRDVLARWTAPHGRLECWGHGAVETRCRFDRAGDEDDTDLTAYVVAGGMPPGHDALVGADAEQFFADREITQIWYSVWCH